MSNRSFTISQTEFDLPKKYVPIRPLGRGAYGVVIHARNVESGEHVAIKKIINAFDDTDEAVKALREVVILRNIRHENVIGLKDVFITSPKQSFKDVYVVYEYMDYDLDKYIRSPRPITNDDCRFFMFQLLRGLHYLHSAKILHRDLKPANILINARQELKIADFGLARTVRDGSFSASLTEYVVTRWYRAPELLLCKDRYDASIDMWSVGCIFAELLGRKPIFPGTNSLNQLELICNILGTPSDSDLDFIADPRTINYIKTRLLSHGFDFAMLYPHADTLALDLLRKMLVFNPKKRITVSDALQHPYISSWFNPSICLPSKKQLNLGILTSKLGEMNLRHFMWRVMLHFNPEAASIQPLTEAKAVHM